MGGSLLPVLHQLHHQPVLLRPLQQDVPQDLRADPLVPRAEGKAPERGGRDVEEDDGVVVVVWRQPPAAVVQEGGQDVVIERKPRGDVTQEQPGARGDAQQQE